MRRKIQLMLRLNILDPEIPSIGDHCIYGAIIPVGRGLLALQKSTYRCRILHNGHMKTVSVNRIKVLGDQDPTSTLSNENYPESRGESHNPMPLYTLFLLYGKNYERSFITPSTLGQEAGIDEIISDNKETNQQSG